MLTETEQRRAAKEFANKWKGIGYEKGDSARFWLSFLHEVYGVDHPAEFIRFEDQVKLDHTSFIDGYIPATHVLIEQKGIDKDLRKPIRQSDGSLISSFQQAKRYSAEIPYSERPRWIVTCNFKEFHIYDMEKPSGEPEVVFLSDLENDYYRMFFMVDQADKTIKKEMEVSIKAGELVGVLYDALLKQYRNPEDEQILKDLNVLCVRLVFCLYAEDAGLFGRHGMFHDYLAKYKDLNFRDALINLFGVLDQRLEDRDPYLEDNLAAFPYVNGGLFEKGNIVIPRINDEIIDIIINKASANFDWSKISPTIFGGVFESTLNPESRRSGGMHYTSIENIHKVIDPLFMNDINEEFEEIKIIKVEKIRNRKLDVFQDKLSSLQFLDPAAGSGNFLTETYISFRRLENKVLKLRMGSQIILGDVINPIKISIGQFYGIEINDFAVTVAKTALWIAESQMLKETEDIIHTNIDFLPLKSYANIVEGNALRVDWNDVVPKGELDYIMGNPPFVGTKYQSKEQKADILALEPQFKKLDYVTGWYKKADTLIQNTRIQCALVSTNSITQGEQVAPLWNNLSSKIDFAYRTFEWNSEASQKAHVHCVIIGFSVATSIKVKFIFDESGRPSMANNINGYLIDAPNIDIDKRRIPVCKIAPKMSKGSQPTDGGNLLLTVAEKEFLVNKHSDFGKYIKRYVGADDLINNKFRYCLWLKDCSPSEIRSVPEVVNRLYLVKQSRLKSPKAATRKWADRPFLFTEDRQPDSDFLFLPVVSSEKRRYMPIGYLSKDIIANTNVQMIPNADLFAFGILNSNVHNSWMRAICGRMKSDYAYSASIVYNNFPWPTPTTAQKEYIEKTAKEILDARSLYPDSSLADLYNELTMPPELRKAHQENDKAVMEAFKFNWRTMTESECVIELMKMYQKLT